MLDFHSNEQTHGQICDTKVNMETPGAEVMKPPDQGAEEKESDGEVN